MPRGSRRSASPSRMSPTRPAARPMASAPAQRAAPQQTKPVVAQPQPSAVGQPVSQGPGLLGQMAATAGGVAIGSTVGHVVGHAITGAFSGGSESAVVDSPQQPVAAQPMQQQYNQQEMNPCQMELRQFLDCTQQNSDLGLCDGFNQVLKECRTRYGVRL
ncbi:coiled-coil-helix-coiled-coil-helix domain-containing protein 2-like protein [Leptotrombidium deliense]|uniref:Coiled-coil-helix-coiled-coil-helix domain-containing protein 2-like protein n=1 Tax=Leptotrombidium deliense TaxID=299467 RepID=A0A443RWY7_9ACAR|nr:coiled-coil-helix-coiled-coil-helix domain-containing protein 2-like protein [Leptotrombidium deliense]